MTDSERLTASLRYEDSGWMFSSGHQQYAHTANLGLTRNDDGQWNIDYGYDGGFWSQKDLQYGIEQNLTVADLKEIAQYQRGLWAEFCEWLETQHD